MNYLKDTMFYLMTMEIICNVIIVAGLLEMVVVINNGPTSIFVLLMALPWVAWERLRITADVLVAIVVIVYLKLSSNNNDNHRIMA